MLSPMDISQTSDYSQLQWQMMMNSSTLEELNNNIISFSSPLVVPHQFQTQHSPQVTALDSTKPRSYLNQYSNAVGGYEATPRGTSQAKDHILAERRRREKLSQRFLALSTLVPGLNKRDKASVLGGTIKYLKHLEERVKFLEEQGSQRTIESVVFMNKSTLSTDTETWSDSITALPEIEVKFSGLNVLIRVHCEKKKGVMETTLTEIEKLKLTVINNSLFTFGSNSIHLTIISQMGVGFNMTSKEVVSRIKSSLEAFMKANEFF